MGHSRWLVWLCLLALVATCTGDHGTESDAAPTTDAAPPKPCTAFAQTAECTVFVDATTSATRRFVAFEDFEYGPTCLRILSGQTVFFLGSFGEHPLAQACGPAAMEKTDGTGSWATFEFSTTGMYGYYCTIHGQPSGAEMAGAIEVVGGGSP